MQRQIPPGRPYSYRPPTLTHNLAASTVTCNLRECTGGPFKPGFRLEWECFDLLNSVIPAGTDHRKAMICGGGETCCLNLCIRRVKIESGIYDRKREPTAGRLC